MNVRTKLKICGITQLDDARYCAAAGAGYLGFIQYEGSPRYIAPAAAKEIIEWVYGPQAVGVFVNEPPDLVNRIAQQAGFHLVQLHGNETPEEVAEIDYPVIKAIRVLHDASAEQLCSLMEPYAAYVDFFLLDTHKTSLWGGTGESFNWRLARELSGLYPLFLAGGIHERNVAEAIQTMHPYAIDLSSSVESSPGIKDFDKLAALFDAWNGLVGAEQERHQE